MDQEYSSFGRTRVSYALSLTEVGLDFKLHLMNTSVYKALPVSIQKLSDNWQAIQSEDRKFILTQYQRDYFREIKYQQVRIS